ncbi:hypothetical protein PX699_18275 [Sphingobium sp. H39-3-25]|uniref:hypothetical protein n=1 Tax=Sphingobium arseniciresistens TaxID=3030834 RepID=UPI0023B96DB6|nr:hypothetical protein [Sphingobium arseniciresistens]
MTLVNLHIDSNRNSWANALTSSLPVSVQQVTDDAGDFVLVDGEADWPERLSAWMKQGNRHFLVIDPVIPRLEALDEAIAIGRETSSYIAISETHADNPAVAPFRDVLSTPYSTVTVTGMGTAGVADLILQQLRLARRIGLGGYSIVHAFAAQDSAIATLDAVLNDTPALLRLTVTMSEAGHAHHRLMAQAPTESACLRVEGTDTARPAHAFRVTADAQFTLPTLYEHAHRAALRAIADTSVGLETRSDLADWKEDAVLSLALTREGSFTDL